MKRVSFLLAMVLCWTVFFSCSDIGYARAQTQPAVIVMKNIKVTADEVNIRQDKSDTGQIISKAYKNDIYELLVEAKDARGRVWYKVEAGFGNVTGWLAGWQCKRTNEKVNTAVKSKQGELLKSCSNKELYIKLLLLEDYSLKNLLKTFGKSYSIKPVYTYKKYEYKNGVYFEVNEENEVVTVGVGSRGTYVDSIKKITGDIFSKNKGNERIILDSSNLIIVDAVSNKVLREYATGYQDIETILTGNFLGDGAAELYLCDSEDYDKSIPTKKAVYKVVNDDFVKACDENSFNEYAGGIKATIDNNILRMNVDIGSYHNGHMSVIPDKVFYNTRSETEKSKLLSLNKDWTIIQENGKWYILVQYSVDIVMLTYYWGPLDENMKNNTSMYNDLARITLLLDMSGREPVIYRTECRIKYNDDKLLNLKTLEFEDAALKNGPELGMTMGEAYLSLGGKLETDEYSDYMIYKDVELFEYCGSIVDIYTKSANHMTSRGVKVGDSIEKVESIYGKPDMGFSGDNKVEYKFCYTNPKNELEVTFYRTMKIYYQDGLVNAIQFHQVMLD
ncbi:MAG: hypothetical protein K0R50_2525 [Eubacterium sp.]|jgi:hypothetical protein|nr:hypothetical protein [Eubacterium sp.]